MYEHIVVTHPVERELERFQTAKVTFKVIQGANIKVLVLILHSPKLPFRVEDPDPSAPPNSGVLAPTRVSIPNDASIGSAALQGSHGCD